MVYSDTLFWPCLLTLSTPWASDLGFKAAILLDVLMAPFDFRSFISCAYAEPCTILAIATVAAFKSSTVNLPVWTFPLSLMNCVNRKSHATLRQRQVQSEQVVMSTWKGSSIESLMGSNFELPFFAITESGFRSRESTRVSFFSSKSSRSTVLHSCFGQECSDPHRKSGPRSQLWSTVRADGANPFDT